MRAGLLWAPTYGRIVKGRDAYVRGRGALDRLIKSGEARRWWTFRDAVTSVMLDGQRMVKSADAFTDHATPEELDDFISECAAWDVPRPSSYASVFHARYSPPPVRYGHNATLAPGFFGGWEEALRTGELPGEWHLYDMKSAYLWAGMQGLPDPRTYRYASCVTHERRAVFCVELREPAPWAPYPYNTHRVVLATPDEIDAYALPVARVLGGVTWSRMLSGQELADIIVSNTFWKLAGRMYWGKWAQTRRVWCHTNGKEWPLPARGLNLAWAHLIVGRVRMRTWDAANEGDAAHVFVDAVLVRRRLRHGVGSEIGDWVHKTTYLRGARVLGAGVFGPIVGPLDKFAGVPKDDPRRAMFDATRITH